ncbi:retrotransposon protein [Tanacetum coccineum]
MDIEEAKYLATLPLDELIGNLKVFEMVLDNDGVGFKTTKEKVKSVALKAKVTRDQTSDDSDSQGGSDEDVDEEDEAEAFNLLAKNFCRGNRFGNKGGEGSKPKGACYNCGIEGHFASECRKPKENKAFIGGAWNNSKDRDEAQNDATCLVTIDYQEVVSKPFSSNIDSNIIDLQKENEELLKFNKDFTKTFEKLLKEKHSLENENSKLSSKINDLELKVKKLANNKEVVEPSQKCVELTQEVNSLKCNVSILQDEALNFSKFKESSIALDDMLSRQKLSQDKEGLGFSKNDQTTSASPNKPIVFVKESQKETSSKSFFKTVVPQTHFMCLKCDLLPDDWILDIGCTKHMTKNRRFFTSYKAYDGGHVVFGSNLKGKVVGGGNITHDSITITNVEHVSGLAFNLISVGQLCDDDCVVSFTKVDCNISKNGRTLAKGNRRNGLYTCKLGDNSKQQICLASVVDNSTLWHRRLGHANMRIVQNLASNELVRNLPKLSFERRFCNTCGLGSQGYSQSSKAYIVLNKETMRIEESLNVTFNECLPEPKLFSSVEDDRIDEPIVQDLNRSPSLQVNVSDEGYPKSLKEARGHPIEQVIGELNERTLRSKTKQAYDFRMTFSKVQIARV